jgi:uncharacterized protein (DUF58 family)
MIAPANRLLRIAVISLIPLLAAAGLSQVLTVPCLTFVALLGALALFDARRGLNRIQQLAISSAASDHKWFKGRPASLELQIANLAGPCEIALDLPKGLTAFDPATSVPAGQPPRFAIIPCAVKERGRYRLERCFARTLSPWRLWQVRDDKPLDINIRVFPDLETEPGAKILFRQQRIGLRRQRPIGRGREFERLREYAHGDNFDEIYWKATARKSAPVVKVFQIERTQDVYVVLDTSFQSTRDGKLERFVNASLMLALTTEKEGDNFGIVSFDRQVTRFVPAARGKHHFTHCRDSIFDLQPKRVSPDFNELFTFLQLRIRRRALLLFLTDLEDPIAAEAFFTGARMVAGKHILVVAAVQDEAAQALFSGTLPESVPAIHRRLAGHLHWATLLETEKKLKTIGVGLRRLRREAIGLDLIDEYADIKRRQIL